MDRPYTRTITRNDRTAMIRTTGTNEVRFSGIDHGNGSKPILLVKETQELVVVKIPGGSHWTGNYQPRTSHPGEYMVLLKLEEDKPVQWLSELCTYPLRTLLETRHG